MKRQRDKPLSELSDAEFSELLKTEYGLDRTAKAAKRIIKPYTGTDDLIAEFKKRGKVKDGDLIKELGIKKFECEFLELDHVRLPFEFIDMVATRLVGGHRWALAQAKARRAKKGTLPHQKKWQAPADDKWAKNPSQTKQAVARDIAREVGGKPDWIRRVIIRK